MTTMVMDVDTTVQNTANQVTRTMPPFKVSVHIDTEVLDPEAVRRKANAWLLLYAGHLLRADKPELLLEDGELRWRYASMLTSPRGGDVGIVGRIQLRAKTGEIIATEALRDQLLVNARILLAQKESNQTKVELAEIVDDVA